MINLEKEIREQPQVLKNIKSANIDTINAIIADVKSTDIDNVYFAARGTSDHACIYAQYLFGIYLGLPCALATPSVVSMYNGKLCLKNSLVFGVSQSGKAEDVLSVIRRANENGTITVAITNNLDSPLAKEAKYHLYCNAGAETSIAATKTFTSQMYLLALLCGTWAENNEFLTNLENVPNNIERLLAYVPYQIGEEVWRFKNTTSAVVLARGLNYPIALEGALKILETNNMKMKGYPISDFWHGPLAQVAKGDAVIVLAAKGVMLADAKAMINRLNEIGASVIVITDDYDVSQTYEMSLKIPDSGSEAVSPFLFAVTMQLIALKLTVAKGIDPDASKVLNKVTITK
jgi:Glucosamine 6-phosphate synthetase, contains amidotransferase and phosphosugar isomerase domains